MPQLTVESTRPVRTRRPAHRLIAQLMAPMAAAITLLLATTSPAVAETGTFTGDWSNSSTALKRVATCVIVTHQETGKTGDGLTECDGANSASSNAKWDNTELFRYITEIHSALSTGKSSNGCPNAGSGTYVKCSFLKSVNIVVTISHGLGCCPELTHRHGEVRWARIN